MTSILIVEDEQKVANFLYRGLKNEGFVCQWVETGSDMFTALDHDEYDLILLDRLLATTTDTIDLLPQIKQKHPSAMILMLTALHDIEDKVSGLRAGADDYLGKPFDFDELLARVEALVRRNQKEEKNHQELTQGHLRIQAEAQRVWVDEREVDLTQLEFQLLRYFLTNPDKVLSRERILNKVWGNTSDPMTNIVDVYIRRLRKKIIGENTSNAYDANDRYIQTLRGVGYRLGPCE